MRPRREESPALGVFEMPHIDLDISHFSIFRAPLGLLEMPYIDLDISHLSSTRALLPAKVGVKQHCIIMNEVQEFRSYDFK